MVILNHHRRPIYTGLLGIKEGGGVSLVLGGTDTFRMLTPLTLCTAGRGAIVREGPPYEAVANPTTQWASDKRIHV